MVLFLTRIGQAFTSIRTAFTNIRRRNRSQSSAKSYNSSIEVVSRRCGTTIEVDQTAVHISVGDRTPPVSCTYFIVQPTTSSLAGLSEDERRYILSSYPRSHGNRAICKSRAKASRQSCR